MTADLRKHNGSIGLDFTPDGRVLVAVSEDDFDVIDIARQKSIKTIRYKGRLGLQASALSADGKSIAIAGSIDKFVRIYPTGSGSD